MPINPPEGTFDASRLVDAYFDGVVSDSEFEQLSDWLRAEEANRRQFTTAAMLHANLRDTIHAADLRSFFGSQVGTDLLQMVDPRNISLMLEEEVAAHPAPETVTELPSEPRRRKPPEVTVPWQAIGYISTAAAAVLLFILAQWMTSPGDKPIRPEIARRDSASITDAPPLVATLTHSLLATWSGKDRTIPINARLEPGVRTLERGVVEIAFNSGARVVVEAPAQLELLSADRMAMHSGRMVAIVPEQAIGFTVLAKNSAVVDLGTEFGIDVAESGDVGVHVLDGEVALLPDAGKSKLATETLAIGDARRVSASGSVVEKQLFDKRGFLRRVPASPYELTVLKSRPLGFWRFDEPTDASRLNSLVDVGDITANVGAGVTLGQPTSRPENGNLSALFAGAHDGIDLGRVPEFDFTGDFTIESWVMVSGNVEILEPHRVFSSFRSSPRSGFALGVAGRGLSGAGFPNVAPHFTFYGVYDFVGTRGMQVNQWHHLVVTVDAAGRPTLYLDGSMIEARIRAEGGTFEDLTTNWAPQSDPVATNGPCFMGKNPPSNAGQFPPPEAWQGGIDEVAVFGRALSETEIKAHFDAGMVYSLSNPN